MTDDNELIHHDLKQGYAVAMALSTLAFRRLSVKPTSLVELKPQDTSLKCSNAERYERLALGRHVEIEPFTIR